MINAYEIGVSITMATNASAILGVLQRDLFGLKRSTDLLQGGLDRVKLAAIGAMAVIGGSAALVGIGKLIYASRELNNELERTAQLGGTFASTLDAQRKQAFATSFEVPTSTPSKNVKLAEEVGVTLGDIGKALAMLDDSSKAAYVVSHFTGEKADEITKNLMRTVDARGQIFSVGSDGKEHVDPEKLKAELAAAVKGLILGGGFISSNDLLQMARQSGPAGKSQTPESFYAAGIEAAVQLGASKEGTALTGLFQQFIGGTMTKKVAEHLTEAGILRPDEWHSGKSGGVVVNPGVAARFEGMIADPQKYFSEGDGGAKIKAFAAKQGISTIMAVFELFGRQTAQRLVSDYMTNGPQFERAREIFGDMPDFKQQYARLLEKNLETNIVAVSAAWTGFMQALGDAGVPAAIEILHNLTNALHFLTAQIEAHPGVAAAILEIAAGTGVLATVLGTAAFVAAFGPAGWVMGIGAAIGAVVAGLAKLDDFIKSRFGFGFAITDPAKAYGGTGGQGFTGAAMQPEYERGYRPIRMPGKYDMPASLAPSAPGGWDGYGNPVAPKPRNDNVEMRGKIYLDGRAHGDFTAQSVGKTLSGPQRGPTAPDLSATPDPAWLGYAP